MSFPKGFMLGSATAAHQVEGNNKNSDYWAMENMVNSSFDEPSLLAVDHYNRYEEDIMLSKNAGLNSYRFSIEWARIEPEKGKFDKDEIEHYRKMLQFCISNGVEPIVTMHHFSSPKWLICEGGWESENTISAFADYCEYVVKELGDLLTYVCTINEANMGVQLAQIIRDKMKQMNADVQVGVNVENPLMKKMQLQAKENLEIFGVANPQHFLTQRTEHGDEIIMLAHNKAKEAMKKVKPELKVGLTLSLHDFQPEIGGEKCAEEEWDLEFTHYMPYIKDDDFIGVQSYTRKITSESGVLPVPEDKERTQMGYEYYPEAIANVVRKVYSDLKKPIIVTENGVATSDDSRRVEFIKVATDGIKNCIDDGIPVLGYMYWSLLDNFEWQKGFVHTFGLITVDRATQERTPKESFYVLGKTR